MKRSLHILSALLLLAFVALLACNAPLQLLRGPDPTLAPTAQAEPPAVTEPTASGEQLATPEPATTDTAPSQSTPSSGGAATDESWSPPPATPLGRFEPAPISEDAQRTWELLQAADPPERDDVSLAQAYSGAPDPAVPESSNDQPQTGQVDSFIVLNIDRNVNVPIEAVMAGASEYAYFWFDTGVRQPTEQEIEVVGTAFDSIYEVVVDAFGQAEAPGIDGNARVHILHASPNTLCDDATFCGLAGYFSSTDALPKSVNKNSNERDMFVMNSNMFATGYYLNVLAHEFRHMIEDNYDRSDADWEIEGSAMFAEELAGYGGNGVSRGNAFLANTDQQLNFWPEDDTYAYYGQGYVLNRYIYDRLGPELYRAFATHPANGLDAVTAVAAANDLPFDGHQLWIDWLVALAIHDHPQTPETYRIGDGSLDTATSSALRGGDNLNTTVHQYAADYYHLEGNGSATIRFQGSSRVPLLDTTAPSGQHYWYAHRVNFSHMQLTRQVDLRNVSQATLNYEVYHDIEVGYDFAYVSVSTDGGETWQGLVAENMQGLAEVDNPAGTALTDRFYTGRSNAWVQESIDLSPYAGQKFLLRFSYVTDPILTHGGIAFDNISIPEIGFYDDAESEQEGWQAQGFTRATHTIPQQWRLLLITFPQGAPVVTELDLDETQSLTHAVNLDESSEAPVLIVAASAPFTLEEALYRLEME